MSVAVFDTSVLSPFARANRIDTLVELFPGQTLVTTSAVRTELANGVTAQPLLQTALNARWLGTAPTMDGNLEYLAMFAKCQSALGAGARNIGESTVLAYAQIVGGLAVIDEEAAVNLAKRTSIAVTRTLSKIFASIRAGNLSEAAAQTLVDELVNVGGARMPCDGASLIAYLNANG